jgi:hypothetical protein
MASAQPAAPAPGAAADAGPGLGEDLGAERQVADREHVLDRGDAADRVFVESVAVGEGADQLAVDVDRAAGHAADDAAVDHPRVGAAEQDRVLARLVVADDVDDLDLEAVRGRCPRTR